MTHPWPSHLIESVRHSLADHGAEMLPATVEEWMSWIPDSLLSGPEALLIPYDEFTVYDWCHLILCAHEIAPDGPATVTDERRGQIKALIVSRITNEEPTPEWEDDDDETVVVVLPLAVFTRGLAALAALSSSSNALISAYITVNGDPPESSLQTPLEFAAHPELTEILSAVTSVSHLTSLMPSVTRVLRDTAGDIEVTDAVVSRMAQVLLEFADMPLVEELADEPLEPAFLGNIGDLVVDCADAGQELFDALEVSELA